jgi:hypothetical protein
MSFLFVVNHSGTSSTASLPGCRQDAAFEPHLHAQKRVCYTEEGVLLHRFIFSIVSFGLPSVQNRALQTRAQPTSSWRCTRAVCGVSSKQNPLSPQTPYDPVKTRFCPIQVQTLSISVFPIFSLLAAPRCGLWSVCVDRLT